MVRRALVAACAGSIAAAIVLACSDEPEPPPPATGDGPDAADDRGGAFDAAEAGPTAPRCRTSAAPSAECAADAAGCERRTLYISATSTFPFSFATDETNVYWVAQDGAGAFDGTGTASVYRVTKSGEATQKAAVLAVDQLRTTTLVRDGSDLLWVAIRETDAGVESILRRSRDAARASGCPKCAAPEDLVTFPGAVRRLVRAGEAVFAIAEGGTVVRLARDDDRGAFAAQVVDKTGAGPSLAASDDHVFAGGAAFGGVERLSPSGGVGSPFLALPDAGADAASPGAKVLGADCERLFGIRHQGELFWSPAASPSLHPTVASFADAVDIVSDERFVYIAQRGGLGVARGARDGGGFVTLYSGDVRRLAIDDQGLYWGEHAKGALAGNVFMQAK